MGETVQNYSPLASTISPVSPNDRPRARAGKAGSETGPRLPFECIALVLQGGGALGAYQAGGYEALAEANLHPDWISGISIGAVNGALIAGNAPKVRVDKLRAFWERVTDKPCCSWSGRLFAAKSEAVRQWLNQMSAYLAVVGGASDSLRRDFHHRGCIHPAR
jgi:NTE family protein